jgi:RNA polymerase sigma-70 factor (ECF subfamily)
MLSTEDAKQEGRKASRGAPAVRARMGRGGVRSNLPRVTLNPRGNVPDVETVLRAAAGDPMAQRALYDGCRPAVFRVARSFASLDPDEVDDVVQESFVRAFRHLARLQDPARLLPWLLTIVRNRALTRLARRRSDADAVADLGREAEVQGSNEVHPAEPEPHLEVELVRRIIEALPEGAEKETVRLFYVDGELSAREIAEKLGVGKSTITMRLERFRAKVKRRILSEVAALRGEESGE